MVSKSPSFKTKYTIASVIYIFSLICSIVATVLSGLAFSSCSSASQAGRYFLQFDLSDFNYDIVQKNFNCTECLENSDLARYYKIGAGGYCRTGQIHPGTGVVTQDEDLNTLCTKEKGAYSIGLQELLEQDMPGTVSIDWPEQTLSLDADMKSAVKRTSTAYTVAFALFIADVCLTPLVLLAVKYNLFLDWVLVWFIFCFIVRALGFSASVVGFTSIKNTIHSYVNSVNTANASTGIVAQTNSYSFFLATVIFCGLSCGLLLIPMIPLPLFGYLSRAQRWLYPSKDDELLPSYDIKPGPRRQPTG